jgi:hypothetical protein
VLWLLDEDRQERSDWGPRWLGRMDQGWNPFGPGLVLGTLGHGSHFRNAEGWESAGPPRGAAPQGSCDGSFFSTQ